jgi:AcrR family transcriptional regulator
MVTKGEQTRDMIIRQAAVVFNSLGYFGTSMSDIMRETGLEKGGIYNHFRNKEELAVAAFEYAISLFSNRLEQEFKITRNAADRLIAYARVFYDYYLDPDLPGGCPILNTAVESDDAQPVLREKARAAMSELHDTICRIIRKGIERNEIRREVDVESTTTILVSMLEGALMLSRLYGDMSHLERTVQHVEAFVEENLRQ